MAYAPISPKMAPEAPAVSAFWLVNITATDPPRAETR